MDDKYRQAEFIAWYMDYFKCCEEGAQHVWDNDHAVAVAWKTAWRAQRPAPSAAANSVLEDAARLWEAFIEAWRNEIGVDKIVNIMGGADKLKAVFLDAARKQGGA